MRHLLALLLLLLASACSSGERVPRAAEIQAALRAEVERGPGKLVSMDSIVRSEWSHMYVFGPYTPEFLIADCLGVRSVSGLSRGIESRDDVNLLIFAYPEARHRSVAVSRSGADFAPEAVSTRYTREQARFITRRPPPRSWGHLTPAGVATACTPTTTARLRLAPSL
jgi:hypothetical protein